MQELSLHKVQGKYIDLFLKGYHWRLPYGPQNAVKKHVWQLFGPAQLRKSGPTSGIMGFFHSVLFQIISIQI